MPIRLNFNDGQTCTVPNVRGAEEFVLFFCPTAVFGEWKPHKDGMCKQFWLNRREFETGGSGPRGIMILPHEPVTNMVPCERCAGEGSVAGRVETIVCPICNGMGSNPEEEV